MDETDVTFRFLKAGREWAESGGGPNHADNPKLALMAVCVANQQKAGFGPVIDIREAPCPNCRAPGFNTGWGFFQHTCGAEVLAGEDGGFSEPRPNPAAV